MMAFFPGGFLSRRLFVRLAFYRVVKIRLAFFPGGFCRVAFIRDPIFSCELSFDWLVASACTKKRTSSEKFPITIEKSHSA